METAKTKLYTIVDNYRKVYSQEYASFCNSMSQKINASENKFGQIGDGTEFLERRLVEIPETLFVMIKAGLTDLEHAWLFPDNDKTHEGIIWFATRFPAFRSTKKL